MRSHWISRGLSRSCEISNYVVVSSECVDLIHTPNRLAHRLYTDVQYFFTQPDATATQQSLRITNKVSLLLKQLIKLKKTQPTHATKSNLMQLTQHIASHASSWSVSTFLDISFFSSTYRNLLKNVCN